MVFRGALRVVAQTVEQTVEQTVGARVQLQEAVCSIGLDVELSVIF